VGEAAELGELGEERERDHAPHAGHALQQIIFDPPDGTGLHGGVQVVIRLAEAALEEANVLLQVAPDRRRSHQQAIALGHEHLNQLPPAGEQGVQRLDLRPGQWPRRGPHSLGEEREDLGIDRIGLGELAGGLGEVAHLARIGDDHG
jgi:hypothetical protein